MLGQDYVKHADEIAIKHASTKPLSLFEQAQLASPIYSHEAMSRPSAAGFSDGFGFASIRSGGIGEASSSASQPTAPGYAFAPFPFGYGAQRLQLLLPAQGRGDQHYLLGLFSSPIRMQARLIVRDDNVKTRNDHTCGQEVPAAVVDVRREMRSTFQAACLANLSLTVAGMVWDQVMATMRESYPDATLSAIGRLPSISIIKYTRAQVTGSDALRAIESAPMRNVAPDDVRAFLQFSIVHASRVDYTDILDLTTPT
ncbi:hypothetical protein BBJ28_00020937 [Nothophytophthora sp. Chile5]|nr:hypothetical protein BBJ28_00020937 [Nothophytophthora sp. Chile5]